MYKNKGHWLGVSTKGHKVHMLGGSTRENDSYWILVVILSAILGSVVVGLTSVGTDLQKERD